MSEPQPWLTLRATTGIDGLDHVLDGGLLRDRLYLIEGNPGSGKTTLALHLLLEGVRRGEPGLYVTLSETAEELRAVAASHGWSLDGLSIHELPAGEQLDPEAEYTLFHPSEVELQETVRTVLDQVQRVQAVRVVFDSLSEMRLLARDPLRYRRQILTLKQFFIGRRCTVLLVDDLTSDSTDLQLESLAHGVLCLEHMPVEYGAERRRLRVIKMRGSSFRGGYHDFTLDKGGIRVYPRLVAAEHDGQFDREVVKSGVPEMDEILGGGLYRGTSTLIMGPAGAGKSSLASLYSFSAAQRGERASLFLFDESIATCVARSAGIGLPFDRYLKEGTILLHQVDPAELSPGEFAYRVVQAVEQDGAKVVVIDSLNGYLNAMPEERFLNIQLHELLTYLGKQGVVTLLVMAQHGLVGAGMESPVDVTYLADTVLLLRYFEAAGEVRQAMSVVKKRHGRHERSIREFRISDEGLHVGLPLTDFTGVLAGVPRYTGMDRKLLGQE